MTLDRTLRRIFPRRPKPLAPFFHYDQTKLTLRRVINLHRLASECERGATVLKSLPPKLVIEATNVCNLSCPACFTGAGENGRLRSSLSLDSFRKVMDELGATLFDVEFYNWGEPFLNKSIFAMIADAHARGISTTISTNFSVPFDEEKAEQLVRSGLDNLGVSIDGASQESYEKYRVGGKLDLVLKNCRMVADAKRRLGSSTPRMIWIFHVFSHNTGDIPHVEKMGPEIGFDHVSVTRGYTVEGDKDWDKEGKYRSFLGDFGADRCMFLWQYAIIHNDGGVGPCCGTFYQEDDLGRLALKPDDVGTKTFREIWNGESFQQARAAFQSRPAKPENCQTVCEACPMTQNWHDYRDHIAEGKPADAFKSRFGTDAGPRYFFHRRPAGRDTKKAVMPVRVKTKSETAKVG